MWQRNGALEHPKFLPVVEPIFVAIDAGPLVGITSGVTLVETLVAPYRLDDVPLADRYEALLTRGRGIRLVDLDRPLLRAAAQLRATVRLRHPMPCTSRPPSRHVARFT